MAFVSGTPIDDVGSDAREDVYALSDGITSDLSKVSSGYAPKKPLRRMS